MDDLLKNKSTHASRKVGKELLASCGELDPLKTSESLTRKRTAACLQMKELKQNNYNVCRFINSIDFSL